VVRLPHLLAALLCGLAAALALGCGDRSNLIPSSRASELVQQLDALQASIDAGACDGLTARVATFHDDATNLGGTIDKRLRTRINQGANSLRKHAVSTCQAKAAEQQQTDTEPSETIPPDTQTDTQPSETIPPDTETDTTPTTPTTTLPTTPTTPTTPDTGDGTGDGGGTDGTGTTPSDNGGVSPDGETP
jgi:hypothetical protein